MTACVAVLFAPAFEEQTKQYLNQSALSAYISGNRTPGVTSLLDLPTQRTRTPPNITILYCSIHDEHYSRAMTAEIPHNERMGSKRVRVVWPWYRGRSHCSLLCSNSNCFSQTHLIPTQKKRIHNIFLNYYR